MSIRGISRQVVPALFLMAAAGCAGDEVGEVVAPGAALYARACGACHGPDGNGTAAAPTLTAASEEAIRTAVAEGVDADPSFGAMAPVDLTPAQLAAIVSHLSEDVPSP
jgi:mono/diheme cytochrome c family protein